jgi:pyruvate kinase
MLSDETANGRYPIEAVKMMKTVVTYAERNSPVNAVFHNPTAEVHLTKQEAICNAVITLSDEINATAIVAETKSGATAVQVASKRPGRPVIAVTSQQRVANQLTLVYGVKSHVRRDSKTAATKLTNWLEKNKVLNKGDVVVSASGKHAGVVGTTDTIKVRVI